MIGLVNQYGSVALAMVQGVVLVPLYLRHIQGPVYAAWLASGDVVAWLALIDPGVAGVMQQRIGHALGRKDPEALGRTIGTGLRVNLTLGLLLGALGVLVAPWVPALVRVTDPTVARVMVRSFALASVGEAVLLCALSIAAVIMALMEFPLTLGSLYLTCTSLGIVATVVLLRAGVGVHAIPLGLMFRAGLYLVATAVLYRRVVHRGLGLRPRFDRAELRAVFGLSGYTWVSRLGQSLLQNVERVLVARLLGTREVTPLTMTRRAADVVLQATTRVGTAFAPAVAHLAGEGDLSQLRDVTARLLGAVGWVGAIGFGGLVGLNRSFVAVWVGPELFGGQRVSALLALALTWQSVEAVLAQTLFATGRIRETSLVTLAEALAKALLLALLLAAGMGLVAVPVAGLAAALGVASVPLWVRFARAVRLPRGEALRLVGAMVLQLAALGAAGLCWDHLVPAATGVGGFLLRAVALGGLLAALLAGLSPGFRGRVLGALGRGALRDGP